MTGKEQEFKQRFIAVLADLQASGSKDAAAMLLLGSLASDLAANLHSRSWPQAKALMTPQTYDLLLGRFQAEGNAHHQAGRDKHAYAVQVLAVSLVASRQRQDPTLASGEKLLDQMIDAAIAAYRVTPAAR